MTEAPSPAKAEILRQSRQIVPILVDYFPDKVSMTLQERIDYCLMLREQLGIEAFVPWTLVRRGKDGTFGLTFAGERLKYLIRTRIHPSASLVPA